MKKLLLMPLFMLLATTLAFGQKADETAIKETITTFAQAGDNQNADELDRVLDNNFRVVMNQLFGSDGVNVMPKNVYLDKIRAKEFGGDKRQVKIEEVLVNGTNASAKVTLKGEKMSFISLVQLIKNKDGQWLLIDDIPYVMPN